MYSHRPVWIIESAKIITHEIEKSKEENRKEFGEYFISGFLLDIEGEEDTRKRRKT